MNERAHRFNHRRPAPYIQDAAYASRTHWQRARRHCKWRREGQQICGCLHDVPWPLLTRDMPQQVLVEVISVDREQGRFSLREVEYDISRPAETKQQQPCELIFQLHLIETPNVRVSANRLLDFADTDKVPCVCASWLPLRFGESCRIVALEILDM